MIDYRHKKALVTGGTRGIGFAVAKRLIDQGMQVFVTGTRNDGFGPPGTDYLQADFADYSTVRGIAQQVTLLKLDVIVNNAGINKISEYENLDTGDFDRIYAVNLRAPMLISQAAIAHMKAQNWGRIVNIGSVFSIVSKEHRASYSSSKFGIVGLTKALAAEVAKFNILVNCLSPGFVDTELTRKILGDKGIAEMAAKIPIGRLGKPDEIAAAVQWLVSDDNTYISGQNIAVDGGFTSV